MKTWLEPIPVAVPEEFTLSVGGHPLIAEILWRRGVQTLPAMRQFTDWRLARPLAPTVFPNMERAVERLKAAIARSEQIAVWGDFDVDGQTSTALLVEALTALGAQVTSYIPHRITEGHGVHVPSLTRLINDGATLILTCDTGVDAHDAIHYARTRNVDVIVTDHHKLPDALPNATAIINPRLLPVDHPLRDLPGVGVAYQLVSALAPQRDWSHLLDLVALGIVADVALIQRDTRYWLQRGLEVLANTTRLGLISMMELARVQPMTVTEETIAFRLAPRLNALGRLGDANPSTELLTTTSLERARILANQLEGLNAERQRLSEEVWAGVQNQVERQPELLRNAALVIYQHGWHTGVLGIVANRCVEAYNRPTLLLGGDDANVVRGSARSVDGVDITDAIATTRHLLMGFGGHTMAAGVTLSAENVAEFRRALGYSVMQQRGENTPEPTLTIDYELPLEAITLPLAEDIKRLAPFGAGNPAITFMTRDVLITQRAWLGRDQKHLRLTIQNESGHTREVKWWGAGKPPEGRFDLAYTLQPDTFDVGEVLIQWEAARPLQDAITLAHAVRAITPHDYRATSNPQVTLESIRQQEGAALLIWDESAVVDGAVNRNGLQSAAALAVWSVPATPAVWRAALERVNPERLYLFGAGADYDTLEGFLKRLGGLVNYALNHKGGQASLESFAAGLGHPPATARAGLDVLAAMGQIMFYDVADGVNVVRVQGTPSNDRPKQEAALRLLLSEAAAYRAYWRRVRVHALLYR
ncbi:MAG: single-stranded-DNA-specific exonuclease RecJ [Phototrophicaceae bacterium]